MPVDKPEEERKEGPDSTPLNNAGNDKPRPPEPADANKEGADLQKRGLLPGARVEVAPGVAVGDKVESGREQWTAKGKHEGQAILYQEGRGATFAGEFKVIDGKPDPKQFKELPRFDGQQKEVSYYANERGQVYKASDMGNGKTLMTTAHDLKLVDPKEIASGVPGDAKAAPAAPVRSETMEQTKAALDNLASGKPLTPENTEQLRKAIAENPNLLKSLPEEQVRKAVAGLEQMDSRLQTMKAEAGTDAGKKAEATKLRSQINDATDLLTEGGARPELMQKLATQRVKEAFQTTDKPYIDRMSETRSAEKHIGSYWNTTPDKVAPLLVNADWKPYSNPAIKPPAKAFIAEIKDVDGKLGMADLSQLPPDAKVTLVDPKGTGKWSLATKERLAEPTVHHAIMILGPQEDAQGKETGKEQVWTAHPGDPVSPSPVDDAMLKKAGLNPESMRQPGSEPGKTGPGQSKEMTVAEFRKLGLPLELAKLENPLTPAEAAAQTPKARAPETEKGRGSEAKAEAKIGDRIDFQGEKLKVGALVEGKAVLYEQGRHSDYAILAKKVTDTELKNNYQEVKVNVNGKDATRYISKGENPIAYELLEVGGKKALYRDNSMEVVKTSELGGARQQAAAPGRAAERTEKTADKTGGTADKTGGTADKTGGTAQPVEAAKLPKTGEQVDLKGEKLNVAGYEGNHALLQKTGRHSDYAIMADPVTDAELKSKYQELKVNIDGQTESRYIEKGHPEEGVYTLTDFGGQKSLFPDHSFEVVPKSDLIAGAKPPAEQRVAKPAERAAGDNLPPPDKQPDRPSGDKPVDRPPDAEIRPGRTVKGEPADERVRIIDGKEIKVRTPQDELTRHLEREVEIDGKTIKLHREDPPKRGQQWYYSEKNRPTGDPNAEQVKLHVTGVSSADLARLQKELLPALEKMREKGEIGQYKTFDPNFMDGKWQDHPDKYGKSAGPDGQLSKAFTIYVPQEKALEVAKAIDKLLKEKGLTLENFKGDNVAEKTRNESESKRVSVERDMWNLTQDRIGRDGALLDESLAKNIHEKYKSLGVDSEGRLTNQGLRAAEKAAGIAEGQLTYDKDGRLMFADKNGHSDRQGSKRFYADESKSIKENGRMTGRPALYALYDQAGLDPAKVHTDQIKAQQEQLAKAEQARPERVAPKADRLQGTDTRVGNDGTLKRENTRPGEVLAREQLERRERVDQKEIDALRRSAEELAKSDKQADREKANALSKTVEALEGRLGGEAQEAAHRAVLAESKRAIERGEGGGYGRAVTGGLIGVGILAAAALAYYNRSQRQAEEKAIERAKVR